MSEMLSTGPVRAARVAWARRTTSVMGVAVVTRVSRVSPICSAQGSPMVPWTAWIWAASRSASGRVSRSDSG